jgi:hypothetical protein
MGRKKANRVKPTHWMLLGGAGLAVTAGLFFWQMSTSKRLPSSRPPLQLALAAAPAVRNAPSDAPLKDEAAVKPVKKVAPPSTKPAAPKAAPKAASSEPAPRVIVRREPAPAGAAVTPDRAAATTPRASKASAAAYETMALKSLEKRDYVVARDEMEMALARGGKARFTIIHDHSRGNFELDDPNATCIGELIIFDDELRFEPRDGSDRFSARWADVKDVGVNRFFGSGKGGFHVSVNNGGKYKNFNLAPASQEKAEARLILDLLESYTRKAADRTR